MWTVAKFYARLAMADERTAQFTEDRIPASGLETTIAEMVDLYGGTMETTGPHDRRIVLPLRRGVAVSGGIECTMSWTVDSAGDATVTLTCGREVDAPKWQRIALLAVGVLGALTFTMWPFFGKHAATPLGTLAWTGGFVALAVYFITLRRTAGGIAYDFLARVARRQRESE